MNVFLLLSCSSRKISIAISATDSAISVLQENFSDKYVVSAYSQDNLSGQSVLWIHKEDSSEFASEIMEQKQAILDYVSKGGHLLLTMDAVRLLDLWEVEPDCETRWMIYPGNKTSRLYTYGKGRILGLVSYINVEKGIDAEISLLLDNTVSVIRGQIDSTTALVTDSSTFVKPSNFVNHSHGCQHVGCKVCEAEYKNINISRPIAWNTPTDGKKYSTASDESITLSAERIAVTADVVGGINEVWVDNQVKTLSRYGVFLDIEGEKQIVSLCDYKPVVTVSSSSIARRYNINGHILTEKIAVSDSIGRVVVVHYEWDKLPLRQMIVDYCADLSLAWPFDGLTSSLYYTWSLELNGGVVRDAFKQSASIVGANIYGRNIESGRYSSFKYDDWRVVGVYTDEVCAGFSTIYGLKGQNQMDVVIAGASDGIDEVLYEYAYVLMFPEKVKEHLN